MREGDYDNKYKKYSSKVEDVTYEVKTNVVNYSKGNKTN